MTNSNSKCIQLSKLALLLIPIALLPACGGSSGSSDSTPQNDSNVNTDNGNPTTLATGQRQFGAPSDGQIRPGVLISSADGSCTSNFVYFDPSGNYYIGAAAHCFSPDTNSGVDSCETTNQLIGAPVSIGNASVPGTLAYSSWQAMQDEGETPGSSACVGNDFALVKIDAQDLANVHPSALVYGGPIALFEGDAAVGDGVYSYGSSDLNLGLEPLREKSGQITGLSDDGWTYSIGTDNPGVPGDSGSAVLHESGKALGVLVTVGTGFSTACLGLCSLVSNGVANLDMALSYANDSMGTDIRLATWNNFTPR